MVEEEKLSREQKRKKYWLQQLKKESKEKSLKNAKCEDEEMVTEKTGDEIQEEKDNTDEKKRRYLLFVGTLSCDRNTLSRDNLMIGNLPYSASSDDIMQHFIRRGVKVTEVRLLTKKGTQESRGCCFLEFQNSKQQQNALKFHHTKFSGRQINVEVTCGGGGRGEERRTKIKKRNEKFVEKYETKKASQKARLK